MTIHERREKEVVPQGTNPSGPSSLSRRSLLQAGTLAGTGVLLGPWSRAEAQIAADLQSHADDGRDRDLAGATIAELQRLMGSGRLTSRELVGIYLRRIRRIDQRIGLNSVLQINPDAERIAAALDRERRLPSSCRPSTSSTPIPPRSSCWCSSSSVT